MFRMFRHPMTITSAFSLAFLLATVVLWVRSYFVCDSLLWQSENRYAWLVNMKGRLRFQHAVPADERCRQVFVESPKGFKYKKDDPVAELARVPGSKIHIDVAGFLLVTGERWQENLLCAVLPHWFICAILGLLPLFQAKVLFPKRARGHCYRCAYDLRASTQRCPECGMPIQSKSPIPRKSRASR